MGYIDLISGKHRDGPALPAELVGGVQYSRDDRVLAFVASGSASPVNVWIMTVASGQMTALTDVPHPGVNLSDLVKPELVEFPARDGLELSGWLYRPGGVSGAAPFVVSFHGGPEGQERPAFRSDYQALVSQGIGVFAPTR
jgi:dipeptidyl aminopeptidase/acylaminoacyl peptidase